MIKQFTDDELEAHSEPFFYPGEESEVSYPTNATDSLLGAIEMEKGYKEWELSRYTDAEIKAEYEKRYPF